MLVSGMNLRKGKTPRMQFIFQKHLVTSANKTCLIKKKVA